MLTRLGTVCILRLSSAKCYCIVLLLCYSEVSCETLLLILLLISISGTDVFRGAYFGEGSGPIFLDKLTCSGQESMLLDCDTRTPRGVHSCDHSQDAGVKCIGM